MKAKYKVTNSFGEAPLGEIRDCFVLAKEGQSALVYHPSNARYECGSFELVKLDKTEEFYISKGKDTYINQGYKDELCPKFYRYIKSLK